VLQRQPWKRRRLLLKSALLVLLLLQLLGCLHGRRLFGECLIWTFVFQHGACEKIGEEACGEGQAVALVGCEQLKHAVNSAF
jgi:hypothetical protein